MTARLDTRHGRSVDFPAHMTAGLRRRCALSRPSHAISRTAFVTRNVGPPPMCGSAGTALGNNGPDGPGIPNTADHPRPHDPSLRPTCAGAIRHAKPGKPDETACDDTRWHTRASAGRHSVRGQSGDRSRTLRACDLDGDRAAGHSHRYPNVGSRGRQMVALHRTSGVRRRCPPLLVRRRQPKRHQNSARCAPRRALAPFSWRRTLRPLTTVGIFESGRFNSDLRPASWMPWEPSWEP